MQFRFTSAATFNYTLNFTRFFHAGDMFDAASYPVVTSPTAFVMRDVLHDWNDGDAVRILNAVAQTIKKSGARAMHRVVIVYRPLLDGASFIGSFGKATLLPQRNQTAVISGAKCQRRRVVNLSQEPPMPTCSCCRPLDLAQVV
jgi:hypothetical protein